MSHDSLIDVAELRELADPLLLDCRFDLRNPAAGRQAYLDGHIPGARHVDLNRDLAAPVSAATGRHPLPAPEAVAGLAAALGIDDANRDRVQVVAYDAADGSFAARAWWLFNWIGLRRIAVLDGGFAAWRSAGGAVEAGEPAAYRVASDRAGTFTPRVQAHRVVTAAQVHDSLGGGASLIVDARAAERFAGLVEPLDPVAGHIPGAVNHPYAHNLGDDGRFLPAALLRRRWLERLGGVAPEDTIAMCGSGVTACHNLLAMARAGLPGARLYAGSWSEWIRDPDRPVARS